MNRSCFPWTLLTDLRCPCCGAQFAPIVDLAGLSDGLQDGTLRCDCYEYPVVKGIPVLRQTSPVSSTHNEAVECLHRGDAEGALQWLLSVGSAPGVSGPTNSSTKTARSSPLMSKLRNLLRGSVSPTSDDGRLQQEGFEAILHANRPRGYANFLFHRFANPSFLGTLPPLVVLGDACQQTPRKRLLDLLCGIGHSSATVKALCSGVEVIMADADYVNLFIARRYVAPDTVALCIDVELPLPFVDGSVDELFCLDGLHYVRSKVALLREVDRIIGPKGAWLFAHMHNANGTNMNPGAPLTAGGYVNRFAFGQQRLLPEDGILNQFQSNGCLDLIHERSAGVLESSNALSLMGTRDENLWRPHPFLDQALFRRPDLLALNPLYRLEQTDDGFVARAAWPSESLQRECTGTVPLFSDTVRLRSNTVQEIAVAKANGALSDEVRKLIRSFVLVCLPECYPRSDLAVH